VRIEVAPISREADGLARSSRNVNLRGEARTRALALCRALRRARAEFERGETDADRIGRIARDVLEEAEADIDYVEIVDPETLAPVRVATADSVCAIAAHVGTTRLIDNATLGEGEAP